MNFNARLTQLQIVRHNPTAEEIVQAIVRNHQSDASLGHRTRGVVDSLCSVGMRESARNLAGNGIESRCRRAGSFCNYIEIPMQDSEDRSFPGWWFAFRPCIRALDADRHTVDI